MTKKEKIIIGLMFLFLVIIVTSEASQQRINWRPSFAVKHKIPFGTYVAHQEAHKLWGNQLVDVNRTPYVYLQKNKDVQGTYLLYNNVIQLGKTNLNALLDWVYKGNNLFISSNSFDPELLDTLSITNPLYVNADIEKGLFFRLLNPHLPADTASIDKFFRGNYFAVNKQKTGEKDGVALGEYLDKEQDSLYNFIRFPFGKGQIYLHAMPYVFTNYFILKSDANLNYFEGLLAYIQQNKPVYWDVNSQTGANDKSLFRYIILNPAFLWAYRLVFTGLLLYIIFEGKRKQRPIPVIHPPRNETVAFTKTIADMYITNREHRQIALMHIKHFMDYVRTNLHIDTRKWDEVMMQKIAQKTKSDIQEVHRLFNLIDEINRAENIKPDQVMKLEEMIERVIRN